MAETLARVMSSDERAVLQRLPSGLLIGGQWRPAASGATFAVEDPTTGEAIARVADATPADGIAALDAATAARATWAATAPRERSDVLRRAFEAVVERRDDLALLMTLEMGKPLSEAHGEVIYGAEFLRRFSEEAVRVHGRLTRAPEGDAELLVTHHPVGPCLLITPWSFPLAMAARKVAPAVAAGCTVVLKPAEQTPLTALAFAQIMLDGGLPAGVLNVITTSEAAPVVRPLMEDARLRKVSFTGSTAVERVLVRESATNLLRTSMELGGNAPFLVFEDADLDAAVDGAMLAKMRNGGEACTAANRFYVHERVAVAAANDTEYGLIAHVYTGDLVPGMRVMNRLETGMVALNRGIAANAAAPFGGVKASGLGREGGPEGIGEYLETRYASLSLDDAGAPR